MEEMNRSMSFYRLYISVSKWLPHSPYIFQELKVGHREVKVPHLQFVDDTLIFCPAKRKLLTNLRRMLDCFQLLAGLKINFSKSGLIGLGRSRVWGKEMVEKLGCQLVELPITYLGIPLGANIKKVSTWNPVITKIQKKLVSWKSKVLSKAGRLVLTK